MTSGDELRQLLHARAIALAAPRAAMPVVDVLELIVFRAGAERYAIDAIEADEAIEVLEITPLPGVPPFYRGLIVEQGVVYPLIDIRALVGAPVTEALSPAHAILFSGERMIAIGAETVESFVRVETASIVLPPANATHSPAVRGVAGDGITLIDIHLLLADARLVIDDRD
jgi:purine-binding chemotaxis protein CheW